MENQLIALTKKLVAFDTVTGNYEAVDAALTYIKKYLKGLHIKAHKCGKYKSLAVSNVPIKRNNYDYILHGHLDVAAASNKEEFKPRVNDGKIFGRGTLDMKGGLACLLFIMKRLSKTTKKKILLLITSDEETGGMYGTEYLLKTVGYRGDFFITAEGEKEYFLKTEQKGVFMFKLLSLGLGEHSAYTWKGKNAITQLFSAYQEIEKKFPHNDKDLKHWYPTINLGIIKGGISRNSIPDVAEAELDIRYCGKNITDRKIEKLIEQVLKRHKNVSYKILYKTPPMKTDQKNPQLIALNNISKDVLKKPHDLYFQNHGTNDARFASAVGIPSVGFGPVGDNYHAKNEYVSIESLKNYYLILQNFINQ